MMRYARSLSVCAVVYFASISPAHAEELVRNDFAYALPIKVESDAAVQQAALPLSVYQHAVRADLGDVRVFNGQGEIVPHALRRPQSKIAAGVQTIALPLFSLHGDFVQATEAIRLTIRTDGGSIDVQGPDKAADAKLSGYLVDARVLKDANNILQPVSALNLQWPNDAADFSASISIEISDDLGEWHSLRVAAPIVNLHYGGQRLIQRRIEFAPTRARYWRLSWSAAQLPVKLTGVAAEPALEQIDTAREQLDIIPVQVSPSADALTQEYQFDSRAQLPVDRINLHLPQINTLAQVQFLSRPAADSPWRSVAAGTLYRLRNHGIELVNPALMIASNTDRYWLVRVDARGGGLGSSAPTLNAGWLPHQLLFVLRGSGPFELAFGNGYIAPATTALNGLLVTSDAGQNNRLLVKPATAHFGPAVEAGGPARLGSVAPFDWKTWSLWSVLLLAVAALGWMAWRLLRQVPTDTPDPR